MPSGKTVKMVFLYSLAFFVPVLATYLARGFRRALLCAVLTGAGVFPSLIYAFFAVRDADKGTNQAEFQTLRWTAVLSFAGLVTIGCWWVMLLVIIPFMDVDPPSLEVFLPTVSPIVIGLAKAFDTLVFDQLWARARCRGAARKVPMPVRAPWVPEVGERVRSIVDGRRGIVEQVVSLDDGRSVCVVASHPETSSVPGIPDPDVVRTVFLTRVLVRDETLEIPIGAPRTTAD